MRAQTIFNLALLAYPRDFRREFGGEMAQVFRDSYRAAKQTGSALGSARLGLATGIDLALTIPKEHWENLGRNQLMNNIRKDAVAIIGALMIIVVAFLLLGYGRRNEVPAILMFGAALDALVTSGVIGNLIIFLLVKLTRFDPLRVALWTLLAVHGVLLAVALALGSQVDPRFAPGRLIIGYLISFLFWFGLHWAWSKTKPQLAVSSD